MTAIKRFTNITDLAAYKLEIQLSGKIFAFNMRLADDDRGTRSHRITRRGV
jgi:hypothetical protein